MFYLFSSNNLFNNFDFHMTQPAANPFLRLLTLLILAQLTLSCSVCQQCTNCGPDVLSDTYIDGIDSLLQNKIQNLGYPVSITRAPASSTIKYQIVYSNGLFIAISLDLSNMQIQLINYSFTPSPTNTPLTSSSSTSSTSTGSTVTTTTVTS